jgi:hypothetical protein
MATEEELLPRLDRVERALEADSVSAEDTRWMIQELRRSQLVPLPAFDVANPIALDPALLEPRTDFDRCVLMLALVFNDLKDLAIISQWLTPSRPAEHATTGYAGQWRGLDGHILRLSIGVIHEFLNFLDKQRRVVEGEEFQALLRTTPEKTRTAWRDLMLLLDKVDDEKAPRTLFFNALRDIRNHTVFHYKDTKPLADGLVAHFNGGKTLPTHLRAYISVGPSMGATRFYFADAAAVTHIEHVGLNRRIPLAELTNTTLYDLNRALAPVVANYVAQKTGNRIPHFGPSDEQRTSRPRSSVSRAKEKAARRARRKTRARQ